MKLLRNWLWIGVTTLIFLTFFTEALLSVEYQHITQTFIALLVFTSYPIIVWAMQWRPHYKHKFAEAWNSPLIWILRFSGVTLLHIIVIVPLAFLLPTLGGIIAKTITILLV